ncbi:MAG TPA: hypothetical protein VGR81_01795 [Candidatus Acidoferrales bacterium]|nr:hypothetical protein [Candidatus Acidoferrales bacterium]
MTKTLRIGLAGLAALCLSGAALAAPPSRYLHVRVDDASNQEKVRVNIPLSLVETVLPAINHGQFHGGEIDCGDLRANGVDLRMILDAVKNTPDGEFVTVQAPDKDVRVAKSNGNLLVHVIDKNEKKKVDVTIPWAVAQALSSGSDKQINIEAAIEALEKAGDTTLVTVADEDQTVRVWIDSRNTAD